MNSNSTMMKHLLNLPLEDVIQVTYVWIGGNKELRAKSRTLPKKDYKVSDLPDWDYDGSSTEQATGESSEVIIKPQAIFKDPFRKGGLLVLADTYLPSGKPHPTNKRYNANRIFNQAPEEESWFGIEQEFFLMKKGTKIPLGFPDNGFPAPQGQYYCSVGASNCIGRDVLECFYRASLYAGLKISGTNVEVCTSQFEFQVGPCLGIEEGDHLYMARYILERVAEGFGVDVNYEPKPIKGDWNGSGCHTNYSTKSMRENGGYEHILTAIKKLELNHKHMITVYGDEDNKDRLTGAHETAHWSKFSWGVANRGATVRVGNKTFEDKKGYLEVRAVSSNIDPWHVTSEIFKTTCL
jgi:glutamine synthetase